MPTRRVTPTDSDKSQAAAAGFDSHLAKPLRMAELTQLLAEFDYARGGG